MLFEKIKKTSKISTLDKQKQSYYNSDGLNFKKQESQELCKLLR
jgi:hypothetical protein